MKYKPDSLGQFEQIVLAAVVSLEDAYGVTIQQKVEEIGGKPVKFGSLYTTRERLEEKGYLLSWMTEPTRERGGRSRRCYKLEPAGKAALQDSALTATRMLGVIGPLGFADSRD
jgi:DNA-binding PadR family transcriptional regulator